MKRIVYTCVAGGIDALKDPQVVDRDTEYICYTDQDIRSGVWRVRPLLFASKDPRLTARMHKTLAHQEDTVPVLWQDGKINFRKSQLPLFDALGGHAISLIRHPKRNCIKGEAEKAASLLKVGLSKALGQTESYFAEGFPQDWGLFETAVMVRNQAKCRTLNAAWWHEISTKTCRDQLSLPYLIWRQQVDYTVLDINYLQTDVFSVTHHPVVNIIPFV